MIDRDETSLLRVAFPSNATAQQPPIKCATGGATGAQQSPAKPASLLDIARNKLRNKHATSAENTVQQAPQKDDVAVAQQQARNNLNSAKQENLANMRDSSLLRVAFPRSATAQQAPSWRWLLHYPGRDVVVSTTPPSTLAEVLRDFPGAIAAEPIKACTLDTPEKTITANREARRLKVIAMLDAAPGTKRAIYVDDTSDPANVILAVAVRACMQTCELHIQKSKYDPWRLLELIERHVQTTH